LFYRYSFEGLLHAIYGFDRENKLSLFIINANSVAIVFTMVWVRVMVFSANEIGVD
jgi:hypothetical protein